MLTKFICAFAADIEAMLIYRNAMGFLGSGHGLCLARFDRFCAEHFPELKTLTKEVVLSWLEKESKSKRSNMKSKTSVIRQFGRHLKSIGKEAYILPDKFFSVKSSFVPYILTDEELKALFRAADTMPYESGDPFSFEIVPVLFRLLYTCGLRPGEGRELKRSNINFNTGEILIVHNKQRKERIVVMSDDMLNYCKQYDRRRNIFARNSELFFPRHDGNPYNAKQIHDLLKKCWARANPKIDDLALPNLRPYDLRHRFASAVLQHWMNNGRNLYAMLPYLRAYMGHESFSSTAYYIHLLPENLVKSSDMDWSYFEKLLPEINV